MANLNSQLHKKITELCHDGDELVKSHDEIGALRKYHEAWKLLPEPKEDWEAATWVLSAIGDTHFMLGDHKNAIAALSNALQCPDALGNPFIHLQLREYIMRMGEKVKGRMKLARAYMAGGKEILVPKIQNIWCFFNHYKPPVERTRFDRPQANSGFGVGFNGFGLAGQ